MVSIKKLYAVIALSVSFLFAKSQVSNAELKSLNSYCECEHVFTNNEDSGSSFLGQKILQTGYEMALINKTIVRGSCWNFVNEVYQRNGFALTKKTIFKSQKSGPFAPSAMVKPGDWIYHINHQFNNIEHSAIFICWKDFAKRIGITLSYAGMNKAVTAKFGEYNLNSIYSIFRP
jgi:hypothetical protein